MRRSRADLEQGGDLEEELLAVGPALGIDGEELLELVQGAHGEHALPVGVHGRGELAERLDERSLAVPRIGDRDVAQDVADHAERVDVGDVGQRDLGNRNADPGDRQKADPLLFQRVGEAGVHEGGLAGARLRIEENDLMGHDQAGELGYFVIAAGEDARTRPCGKAGDRGRD